MNKLYLLISIFLCLIVSCENKKPTKTSWVSNRRIINVDVFNDGDKAIIIEYGNRQLIVKTPHNVIMTKGSGENYYVIQDEVQIEHKRWITVFSINNKKYHFEWNSENQKQLKINNQVLCLDKLFSTDLLYIDLQYLLLKT